MTRTVLIDGDILVYKAALVSQEEFEENIIDDDEWLLQIIKFAHKNKAIKYIEETIARICKQTKSQNCAIALSDKESNFRKLLNPDYKGNRKKPKPLLHGFLREYFKKAGYKVYEKPSLEGDDVIGILATSDKIIKGDKVIWSFDKDFKTIPCKFRKENPDGSHESKVISEEEADWNFMYQTLIGDSTDGYKGCKGVGDKTARKLLGEIGEKTLIQMWDIVKEQYIKAGLKVEDALLNARMARILRVSDYDFKNKKVKLWQI